MSISKSKLNTVQRVKVLLYDFQDYLYKKPCYQLDGYSLFRTIKKKLTALTHLQISNIFAEKTITLIGILIKDNQRLDPC